MELYRSVIFKRQTTSSWYYYEFDVVDHLRSFEEVNLPGQRAVWGQRMVVTPNYIMCEREGDGNDGMVGSEALLAGLMGE